MLTQGTLTMLPEQHIHRDKIGSLHGQESQPSLRRHISIHATPFLFPSCDFSFKLIPRDSHVTADLEGGVHEAFFFLSLLTTQMHLVIRGQHLLINAWIKGNKKKCQYNVTNMKLSASKFNEKNVFRQFQKKKFVSQMSAVRMGILEICLEQLSLGIWKS